MKRITMTIVGAALLCGLPGCAGIYSGQAEVRGSGAVQAQTSGGSMSMSYFYDSMAPYGRWIEYSSYGWCWTPYDVEADWRPYSAGHWVYTEFGWTWVSDEPWGWAAYHYGRWLFDPGYGWVWIPDRVWGPAWVAWCHGDDWVGWAPLPPDASWQVSVGLQFGSIERIPPPAWCFVESRHMVDANLRYRVVSVARNATLLGHVRNATRFEVRDGRPLNRGVDVAFVEKVAGRPMQRLRVVDVRSPAQGRGRRLGNDAVGFFRPSFRDRSQDTGPRGELRRESDAMPEPQLRARQEAERRRFEQSLAQERSRLRAQQERELRETRQERPEEIRRRHQAENQAFEDHAARQRQVVEQRLQKKILKPARAGHGEKPAKQEKRKGKEGGDRGQG